jgi:3',5'-cyclic-AMP phosphodiesterase
LIIAQLSDIHFDGSQRQMDRLDTVLGWLKPLAPDCIIVSGDLAEPPEERHYRVVKAALERIGAPVHVVPGNVDDPQMLRQVFGASHEWAEGESLHGITKLGPDLRVIGLDVTVPGEHYGDARPALGWLERQLNSGGPPALIFQHQHPFPTGIDGKDKFICHGGEEMADLIERAGDRVLGLTCGHVHRPMATRFAGRQASMCPSVTRANRLKLDGKEPDIADPPGLMVHHVSGGRLVSHVVMVS